MKKNKFISILILLFLLLATNQFVYADSLEMSKPVITFVDDDNKKEFLDMQKSVFDKYGIKTTLAVITNTINQEGYLNIEDLYKLKNEGFDIVSHTANHSKTVFKAADTNLSKVKDVAILEEYEIAYKWIKENGFNTSVVVYPWGEFGNETERYAKLASKYYEYGLNSTSYSKKNDRMYINRLFLNKNKPLKQYEEAVNKIIESNGWLIIGTHSKEEEMSSEYLEEFIQYAQTKNVEILPFSEASNIKFTYIYQENRKILTKKNMFIVLIVLLFCGGGIFHYIYKIKPSIK